MSAFELYAAIDVLGGRSVRLRQGAFDQVSDYGDPLVSALELDRKGAGWLHLVDLAAARSGRFVESETLAQILDAVSCKVQVAGGIRSLEAVSAWLDRGAARVVMGTGALEDLGLLEEACRAWPGRVAVALDHLGAPSWRLAVRGWSRPLDLGLEQAARYAESLGAAALVVTSIPTDGMLGGPDLVGLSLVLEATESIDVVASGGVRDASDLANLARLETKGRVLAGAVVGRALRDGRLGVEEALAACAR